MIFKRIFVRSLSMVLWIFLMSLLGFAVSIAHDPNLHWTFTTYYNFMVAGLTNGNFYQHSMHTVVILKNVYLTLELVITSVLMALVISIIINTYVLKRPKLEKWFFSFFSIVRIIPFIIIPLIFNKASESLGQSLQVLDESNFEFSSLSRIVSIFSGKNNNSFSLLVSFLTLAFTASSFILPTAYIIIARVTKQVVSYPYVKTLATTWSSYRLMRKMVLHRLIPILLNELPSVIAYFLMFVGCLEYVFHWKGIGLQLVPQTINSGIYSFEAGLTIFILGTLFIMLHFLFVLIRNLYDYNKRKELPYEID